VGTAVKGMFHNWNNCNVQYLRFFCHDARTDSLCCTIAAVVGVLSDSGPHKNSTCMTWQRCYTSSWS